MHISMSLKECIMRIIELYRNKKPVISFEVFPPKPDTPIGEIYSSLEHFSKLNPAFISVTYRPPEAAEDNARLNYLL